MVEVGATLLNAENENVIKTIYNLETSGIDYFHIDLMDGKFVENNTTERMREYCEYINSISNLPLDMHLMVEDIEEYIKSFSIFEPNIITFHIEATKGKEDVMKLIKQIKEYNIKVGIAISPNTKIEEILEYLPYIHIALVMTVEPGKGGQKLIESTIKKVENLNKYISDSKLEVDIEVDGGINDKNADTLKKAGANIIVAGTSILKSKDYKKMVDKLKK